MGMVDVDKGHISTLWRLKKIGHPHGNSKRNDMIYCRYMEVLRIYSPLIIAKFYAMEIGQ